MQSFYRGLILTAVVLAGAAFSLPAQTLPERTLVVYNSANAESVGVADYYMSRRSVPSSNLCAVTSPSLTGVTQAQFDADLKAPIQQCVTSVGKARILYIVLAYPIPYKLNASNGRTYSVDQALADLWNEDSTEFASPYPARPHGYYVDSQSQGGMYPPFLPFASFRATSGAPAIYSVWRLDGANASIARGLVDKAIQAELSGLTGTACLDRRYGGVATQRDTNGDGGAEWDLARSAQFAAEAGFPVIEDANYAEFGTSPAPARCDNAMFYAGWYSLNKYWDVFTWNPGAIGFHLDGNSALDPRGGTNWAANALLRGITVTSGALASPSLFGFVHPDGIFRNLLEGSNIGDAILRNSPWLKWVVLNIGDPLYRPFPGGRAPFNTARLEDGLALNPRSLVGGGAATGTVRLSSPAPAGGASVALSTSSASTGTVPANVTVPAGATSATFPISTGVKTAEATSTIRAVYGGVTRANTLVVLPTLSTVVLPSSVAGGAQATGTVLLTLGAPAGGVTVALSSSDVAAGVPASVFIPGGADRSNFTITTQSVAAKVTVTIAASHGGATRSGSLDVNPPVLQALTLNPSAVVGGSASTGTVTLTGKAPPGGLVVTLSSNNSVATVPPSVTVTAGAASAAFNVSTSAVTTDTTVSISGVAGSVTKSGALSVRTSANVRPTVALTSPAAGNSYLAPATVNLSANASDRDGTIAYVEFRQGSTVICTDTASPYSCTWTAPGGTYSVSARAYDNAGSYATSQAASITVRGIRIMPLGDSITHGADYPGAYRVQLWQRLINGGTSVNFVGSESNGPAALVDKNHQGHRGWRIDMIQGNVGSKLTTFKPQIVLLHIGTNDMLQGYDLSNAPNRLSALVDQITTALPTAYVVVASIIPLQDPAKNSRVVSYNAAIPGIVQAKRAAGQRVSFIDMYNIVSVADLYDGIHPNTAGQAKMAEAWFQSLGSILPLVPLE